MNFLTITEFIFTQIYAQISIGLEAGWAPESVWTTWKREYSYHAGNWTRPFQLVVRHYTDWAIPTIYSEW
jgi:hypothetical protein